MFLGYSSNKRVRERYLTPECVQGETLRCHLRLEDNGSSIATLHDDLFQRLDGATSVNEIEACSLGLLQWFLLVLSLEWYLL